MEEAGRRGLVVRWSEYPSWIALHDTLIGEWVEVRAVDCFPSLVDEGIPSIKLFMAYKGVLQVDDQTLFRSLVKAAEHGLLTMVHAENGDVIADN